MMVPVRAVGGGKIPSTTIQLTVLTYKMCEGDYQERMQIGYLL